jgi:FAD/FMN-containing dehydrogenase
VRSSAVIERIVGQVMAAVESRRPVEVWGGGSLLGAMAVPSASPQFDRLETGPNADTVEYEPADLVITVGAGMKVADLDALLEPNGQECPIDAHGAAPSTVGGRVATGLSGVRRLGCGPVRDWVLGMTFVTGDGRVCRAGGRTVKNVTGFDLPRLLCGSWGTLGVLVDITLRVRPRPRWSGWYRTDEPVGGWLDALHDPASVLVGPDGSYVLLEGHPDDGAEQAQAAGLRPSGPPALPGPSCYAVSPDRLPALLNDLPAQGWVAQWGVGVVHLDPGIDLGSLDRGRHEDDGRLLRLDGGEEPDLRRTPRQPSFHQRLKHAFDPHGVLAPWRFPA